MNRFTTLLCFCAIIVLSITSCQKDSSPPVIQNFQVNGTILTESNSFSNTHALGELVMFEMDATDDSGLDKFIIIDETDGARVLESQDISGSSSVLKYDFDISADNYVVGDSVILSFTVEDDFGNFDLSSYKILVDQ